MSHLPQTCSSGMQSGIFFWHRICSDKRTRIACYLTFTLAVAPRSYVIWSNIRFESFIWHFVGPPAWHTHRQSDMYLTCPGIIIWHVVPACYLACASAIILIFWFDMCSAIWIRHVARRSYLTCAVTVRKEHRNMQSEALNDMSSDSLLWHVRW